MFSAYFFGCFTLEDGTETSVTNYQSMLHKIPKQLRSHLHWGRSVKQQIFHYLTLLWFRTVFWTHDRVNWVHWRMWLSNHIFLTPEDILRLTPQSWQYVRLPLCYNSVKVQYCSFGIQCEPQFPVILSPTLAIETVVITTSSHKENGFLMSDIRDFNKILWHISVLVKTGQQ